MWLWLYGGKYVWDLLLVRKLVTSLTVPPRGCRLSNFKAGSLRSARNPLSWTKCITTATNPMNQLKVLRIQSWDTSESQFYDECARLDLTKAPSGNSRTCCRYGIDHHWQKCYSFSGKCHTDGESNVWNRLKLWIQTDEPTFQLRMISPACFDGGSIRDIRRLSIKGKSLCTAFILEDQTSCDIPEIMGVPVEKPMVFIPPVLGAWVSITRRPSPAKGSGVSEKKHPRVAESWFWSYSRPESSICTPNHEMVYTYTYLHLQFNGK